MATRESKIWEVVALMEKELEQLQFGIGAMESRLESVLVPEASKPEQPKVLKPERPTGTGPAKVAEPMSPLVKNLQSFYARLMRCNALIQAGLSRLQI